MRKLFDKSFYLRQNGDVAKAGINAFEHFMSHGWIEGRNPSASFVTLYYRDTYLQDKCLNPLVDYVRNTAAKRDRRPTPATTESYIALQRKIVEPFFSVDFYKSQVPALVGDCLLHYLSIGWREGLLPSDQFNTAEYVSQNRYIVKLGICPLYHFASQSGMDLALRETPGRDAVKPSSQTLIETKGLASRLGFISIVEKTIAPHFDPDFYLARNEDVRSSGSDPLKHYCNYGWREKRMPNSIFDAAYYVKEHPEVADTEINSFYHYLTVGSERGFRPNAAGFKLYEPMVAPDHAQWSLARPASNRLAPCVVIMPVYKGRDETLSAIFAVLTAVQEFDFILHVVNDQSPDAELVRQLEYLADAGLFYLTTNNTNLGFVATVNKSLLCYPDIPAVLLNTDAKVSNNWLDRMLRHLNSDKSISTVTPFSNNATIFSYPLCNFNNIFELERGASAIDEMAARANESRTTEMLTGVGFCFAMSARSREVVGLFDEVAFGKGYGEENDFCLRATKAGFRNVLAEDVFVYHVGKVSFGSSETKDFEPGQDALLEKHPEYLSLVKQHLESDPSEQGRIRLDLMRIAADAGPDSVVFVYHSLSGGIITHILHEEDKLNAVGKTVIHVRVGVQDRWGVEIRSGSKSALYTPNLWAVGFNRILPHFADFIKWLKPNKFHIHSLVGFDWQSTTLMMKFISESGFPYDFTLHDYSVVCHRNDLVLTNNRYCGLPDVDACRICVLGDRSYPEGIDPGVRRSTFAKFLGNAATVFAPSNDIAIRLRSAGATYSITVRPHDNTITKTPPALCKLASDVTNIVILGAVGPRKGSRVIASLAKDAQIRGLALRYFIVGYSDSPSEMTEVGVTETGRYSSSDEAFARLEEISPDFIFIPSIWPETFSYTLSMAFLLRCRPIVFDIGAQAERVRQEGFGIVLPYDLVYDIKSLSDALLSLPKEPRF